MRLRRGGQRVEHLAHRESRQDSRAGLHRDALATLNECLAVEPLVDGIGRIRLNDVVNFNIVFQCDTIWTLRSTRSACSFST